MVNPAAWKIFGYSTEEMIGQPLTMLMPEYRRHLHKARIHLGSSKLGLVAVDLKLIAGSTIIGTS